MAHVTPIRRSPRPGLPDGSSTRGIYVAHWTDEDSGHHEATLEADSEQDVRDLLEHYIGNNTLKIEGPIRAFGG